MSKKRKTRKQKEASSLRQIDQNVHIHPEPAVYSITNIKSKGSQTKYRTITDKTAAQKDSEYLKHDMIAISAASGIVVAFEVLFFILLSTNTIKLNFLGY